MAARAENNSAARETTATSSGSEYSDEDDYGEKRAGNARGTQQHTNTRGQSPIDRPVASTTNRIDD